MGNKGSKKSKIKGPGYSLKDTVPTAQKTQKSNYKPQAVRVGPQSRTAAQARAIDRYQSHNKPIKKPKGNLQRKEQILAVMEDADRLKTAKATVYYDELSSKSFKSKTAMNEYRYKHFGVPIPNSTCPATKHYPELKTRSDEEYNEDFKFTDVEANTNVGKAALARIQSGVKKKKRLGKTADMILADSKSEDELEENTRKNSPKAAMRKKKKPRENDWYIASGGASEAARTRMVGVVQKKKGKSVLTSESRAHELLYGDALKQNGQRVFKASDGSEYQSAFSRDKYEEGLKDQGKDLSPVERIQEKLILFVNESDPDVVAGTAKTMLKMIDNLLKAESVEEKEKFGRLRLTNKAIIKRFVKVPYALALLGAIGFVKATSGDEDILNFQYNETNRKSLDFLKQCIEEYQEEAAQDKL